MIGSRTLTVELPEGEREVLITIETPAEDRGAWICRYRIEWPEGRRESYGAGFDALQAIYLAMTKIGTELYTSEHHERGALRWDKPGSGYGFPVTPVMRDLLIGEDKSFYN
jgi:hypothetical protein